MDKKVWLSGLVLIGLIVTGLAAWSFYSSKPAEQVGGGVNNPPVEEKTSNFEESFISGFEGVNFKYTYSFKVPDKFKAYHVAGGSRVRIVEGEREHEMWIVSNDALGLSSPDEWLSMANFCDVDCKKVDVPINFSHLNLSTMGVYGNKNTEVVVLYFGKDPFDSFVIFKADGSSSDLKSIVESFNYKQERTTEQIGEATVKVYFANDKVKKVDQCDEVIPVERIVFKTTPRIAALAIEALLRGPEPGEQEKGYVTNIPENSKLNSLDIRDGVAYADFNLETESGGGSCSMRMRTSQIEQTLLQFPTIKSVKFSINGRTGDIFQP